VPLNEILHVPSLVQALPTSFTFFSFLEGPKKGSERFSKPFGWMLKWR